MAYPATKFTVIDNSDIDAISVPEEDTKDRPVYMTVFSADKGPEEWQNNIMGQTFYDLYGSSPSFSNHGQPLIQASAVVNAGGRLMCKRLVAEDATLANILVQAVVKNTQVPKQDSSGQPVYYDTNGNETTNAALMDPTKPNGGVVMVQKCGIDIQLKQVSLAGNSIKAFAQDVKANEFHTNTDGTDGTYSLFLITDNGRGLSNKKFRIYADTSASRPVDYVKYIIVIKENGVDLETMSFTLNPDVIESSKNISLQNVISTKSKQVRCRIFESEIKAFAENAAFISGINYDAFINSDILFGNDLYGNAFDKLVMGTTVRLDNVYGISLMGGTNGVFGTSPINASTYSAQAVNAFNGNFDDMIYDLDNTRIDVIFDANYDDSVKRAIENFVEFREDCFYFRDMGLDLENITQIKNANVNNLKSRLCATYQNSWDVIEPYSKKQITVTCLYSLATAFVTHFLNGRSRPFCGQLYSVTFPDVIEGTVNFTPKNTPTEDQKQAIDDLRINYCGYYNGVLTMETEYTSQEKYTQLSWLSNVLTIQELIKAIRQRCPKIRYNFLDSDSLKKYEADVQTVIDKFTNKFESITMEYVEDNVYKANKIFYAVISVKMKDFVQTELFKITVLKNS